MDVGGDKRRACSCCELPDPQLAGARTDLRMGSGVVRRISAVRLYFPLPAVIIGILNVAFPYAVAFKLVTVLARC